MTDIETEIPSFPMARDPRCPFQPPPAYARLRAEQPVSRATLWNGQAVWLITRHADQRAVLSDPRFSADTTRPGHPPVSPAQAASLGRTRSFVFMDDPEHDRYRRMLTKEFTVRRVEAMRPRIQQIVDGLIDDMLAGPRPVDLVRAFALPVPSLVICELLGVPYHDHDFFQQLNAVLVARDCTPEQALTARRELKEYLDNLVAAKDRDLGDDLISRLLVEQVRPGRLSHAELGNTAALLLLAGHETTANMISLGVLALLQHPQQLSELRDTDDPKLVATAVDELMRYLTIGHSGLRRVATVDVELSGQLIRAGEGVVLLGDAGNHDEAAFDDPGHLDIHRQARHHLAFGHGVHQCLGASLARTELQVVYPTLLRRVPGLRTAVPVEEIPFRHDMAIYGVHELPVTW